MPTINTAEKTATLYRVLLIKQTGFLRPETRLLLPENTQSILKESILEYIYTFFE